MKIKHLISLLLLISGWLFTHSASASCYVTANHKLYYTNIGNNIVQRDLPVGSTIAQFNVYDPYPGQMVMTCNGSSYYYYSMEYAGSTLTSYSHVYSTNVPGVGIKLDSNAGYYYDKPATGKYVNNVDSYMGSPITASFIKTGPITSGALQNGLVARIIADTGGVPIEIYIASGSFTQVACSITTPRVDVPLDPVLASSFTGVNSTKGDKPFTIGLNCDAGARINASLSFDQNTDTSNTSVIKLTGAGSAGVATGVGIQLLYGSTPLQRNTNIVLKTSSGGQEFPAGAFTARYFQTKSTVTTGDANATATLNLTYQ